jgi:UDP-2,4-diacetamido-2,4,6-trideoxy-beta-L-altropyranose hydrolase
LNFDNAKEATDELAHASWLGTSQAQDAKATVIALDNRIWDWIVVDHYALDERWESTVRKCCKKLMVIDDIADHQHDCDVLLDQNFYADMQTRYLSKAPAHCQFFLGPRYALLREEFRVMREKVKVRTGDIKKILVFFGGVDTNNYTSLALQALSELDITLQVNVVIGSQHPNREQIQQACIHHGFICHIQTTHMAELMAEADLAIGAGGSASWERCCLGLPALLIAVSGNQIDIAKSLDSIGACYYLGEKDSVNSSSIQHSFNELLVAPDQVLSISQQAFSLVDGLGLNRVSEALGC